ncbi:MAG: ABC transporter permease [Ruminiclostridium sp.]
MNFRNTLQKVMKSEKTSLVTVLILVIGVFTVLNPNYFSYQNLKNILFASSVVGLVAIGETFLIIAGQIDLSAGAVAAFSGVLAAILLKEGIPMPLTVLIVLIAGMVIGLINAELVNGLKIQPFIATLATMSVFRGFAFIISDGNSVFVLNKSFISLGAGVIFGIPIPIIILIVMYIIFGIILARTRLGRSVYMIGGNPVASRLAGLSPNRIKMVLYMITSVLAALGGILLAGRMNSGQPTASSGMEFVAITATVLGGIAFSGGIGTIGGCLLGLLILQSFNNGLTVLNVPTFWQTVAQGMLLIIALAFDFVRKVKRNKNE